MKRLISALLALTLVLALAGCSGNKEPGGTITPKPNDTQETTTAPAEETTEATVSLGRMEGGVYTNEYAGFGLTADLALAD